MQQIRLAFFSAALSEEHRHKLDWLAWHAHPHRNPARSYRRALSNRIASTPGTNRERRFLLWHSASASSIARHSPTLRLASATSMPWFYAFNLVWVNLSIAFSKTPYSLNPTQIGLYSLTGVLGLLVTRCASSLYDRYGPHVVVHWLSNRCCNRCGHPAHQYRKPLPLRNRVRHL